MQIRKTTEADLSCIGEIYENAKRFMRESGNPDQWNKGTPNVDTARADMERGVGYVAVDDEGEIVATFMFTLDGEPTYAKIYDGAWLNDAPYGVIHRIASNGTERGVLKAAIEYCAQFSTNLRIDTHRDNTIMQHLLEKYGFQKCGIIYVQDAVSDHSPRLAYHRVAG